MSRPAPTGGFHDNIPSTVIMTADGGDGVRWTITSEFDPVAVHGAAYTYRRGIERHRWVVVADAATAPEIVLCAPVQPRRGTVLWLTDPDGSTTTWHATGVKRRKRWQGTSKTINVEPLD